MAHRFNDRLEIKEMATHWEAGLEPTRWHRITSACFFTSSGFLLMASGRSDVSARHKDQDLACLLTLSLALPYDAHRST